MTLAYHRYHGVDTKIVRIFNTYGPRMRLRDGRAVPAFMSQALKKTSRSLATARRRAASSTSAIWWTGFCDSSTRTRTNR
jgi:nucleoside-diphosphate-sugar epimerase